MNADDICALEDRRCDATVAGDVEALADIYADDLRYTHSHGGMDSKQTMISNIANGVFVYREIHRSDVVVTMFSGTAVITGRARLELTAAGTDRTVHCRYTNVWAEHDGRWQFVAWQSTPVPASWPTHAADYGDKSTRSPTALPGAEPAFTSPWSPTRSRQSPVD